MNPIPYVQVDRGAARHPKVRRLMRALGIPRHAAFGLVCCLWSRALDDAPDGDLRLVDRDDFAAECGWEGDPDALWGALVESGWVDQDGETYTLHGWMDEERTGGKVAKSRDRDREKKKVSRSRPHPVPGESPGTPKGRTGESPGSPALKSKSKREEQERELEQQQQAAAVAAAAADLPELEVSVILAQVPLANGSTWPVTAEQVASWAESNDRSTDWVEEQVRGYVSHMLDAHQHERPTEHDVRRRLGASLRKRKADEAARYGHPALATGVAGLAQLEADAAMGRGPRRRLNAQEALEEANRRVLDQTLPGTARGCG